MTMGMGLDQSELARFEAALLPHLDAAYDFARHLVRDPHAAEDVIQDAYLRALKYFRSFRGTDGKGWLLAIVRHVAFSRRRATMESITAEFDEELHGEAPAAQAPDAALLREETAARVHAALGRLPARFREVLVLRELEELSYEEIGRIARIPAGTVMSRLARARERLRRLLLAEEGPAA